MGVVTFRRDSRISESERYKLRLFASQAGQNIHGLVQQLGLRVDFEYLDDEISAALIYAPNCGSPSGYRIAVNAEHSVERQRWSIAHEIGHFVLHREDPDFTVFCDRESYGEVIPLIPPQGNSHRSSKKSSLEREADAFSASLLMPAYLVRKSINFRVLDIRKLANEFFVSYDAMARRVNELRAVERASSSGQFTAEGGRTAQHIGDEQSLLQSA